MCGGCSLSRLSDNDISLDGINSISRIWCHHMPVLRPADLQHARTSSSLGLPRSSALAHSPSLPRLEWNRLPQHIRSKQSVNCFKVASRLHHWQLLTDMCRDTVWQVISLCVDARPCNDFSVVLRRVRNCLRIIINNYHVTCIILPFVVALFVPRVNCL